MSTNEEKFAAEVARTVGPTNAEALVEFFKRSKQGWLILNGEISPIDEAELTDQSDDSVGWLVWV